MKHKLQTALVLLLLFIPSVSAQEECGLRNLPACIVDKFYQYTIDLFSSGLDPLTSMVKDLFIAQPDISAFSGLWSLMIYIVSFFYVFVFLWAGFLLIFSGSDIGKRVQAKRAIERGILMMVFVQASFFIYGLFVEISSSLTAGIFSMIDPSFFSLTMDSFVQFGLQLQFIGSYFFVLFLTLILLALRYLIVSVGVVFFAIGLFLYFFDPLEKYGRMIINFLGVTIFMPFFGSIILLASSVLLSTPFFSNWKILAMMSAYFVVCLLFAYFLFFALIKSVIGLVLKISIAKRVGSVLALTSTSSTGNSIDSAQTNLNQFK